MSIPPSNDFPRMCRVRQTFPRPVIADIASEVRSNLGRIFHSGLAGRSVAITVGSRGIANIAEITRAVVAHIRGAGGSPFIVPAMGSHGGATAEGQRQLIESFGVTEQFVGAEIRSSMETVIVAETKEGIPVHFDRHAWEADHVLVMGRVKPHTGFVGEIESGLHKMMLIGLGKHSGALTYHRAIKDYSFGTIIRSVAEVVLEKCGVLAGLAIVENAYDETALIEAVAPEDFYDREVELLKQAVAWMPQLPVTDIDLLIVDQIGKNISGTGMDTNIVGRKYNDHVATEKDRVNCRRIFVRGLTELTKGNATGIGIAEFTNQRTVDRIDMDSTRINCMTSSHPTGAMIPCVYSNDRAAIEDALKTIGMREPHHARVVQIRDTLHLADLLISEAALAENTLPDHASVVTSPEEMAFDANGDLADV
ncbi:MAG: DUF2088 domain-containing protein [Planctomycetaceae bacterium]|nr:DUF2088 domain-containing protein [Planctomycetaceae bacterium]